MKIGPVVLAVVVLGALFYALSPLIIAFLRETWRDLKTAWHD